MYEAMGLTILSSMDDLDRQFIEKHPDIAGKSGADLIVILLVGQKIFTVVLGDFKCYVTKKSDANEQSLPLSAVTSSLKFRQAQARVSEYQDAALLTWQHQLHI